MRGRGNPNLNCLPRAELFLYAFVDAQGTFLKDKDGKIDGYYGNKTEDIGIVREFLKRAKLVREIVSPHLDVGYGSIATEPRGFGP